MKSPRIQIFILILFFIKTTPIANAQGFQPILNGDSVSWDIAHKEFAGIVNGKLTTSLSDDSVYHELYSNMYEYDPDANPELYMGKLREDTVSGKLWYVNIYGHQEILIMDMSLSVGDTFEINPGHWHTVDSVFYENNRKIIQFDLSSAHWIEKVQFIEGVGPNMSVLYRYDAWYYFYAACQYRNNELVYVNNNGYYFDGCTPLSIENSSTKKLNTVKIYPNPTKSGFWIDLNFDYQGPSTVSIFNSMGNILLSEEFYGSRHQVSLFNSPTGIYYVKVNNNKLVTQIKLLLIN